MAAPSYTEDLTDFALAETAEGTGGTYWDEPGTGTGWETGGTETFDTDYPLIQGSYACTQQATKASIGGLIANNPLGGTPGAAVTVPTDGAFFVWQFFASGAGLDTEANGGFRVICGNSFSAFYGYKVGGSTSDFYPYGGWQNHAVNPDSVSADYTVGTPSGSWSHVGAAYNSTIAIGKGNVHGVDAIRYGRGSSIFTQGDVTPNGPCTFSGFVAADETSSTRWGLARTVPGGYLWQGRMQLGTSGTAVYFVDQNKSITWARTPKVSANFNLIEVNNASSQVDWTNVVHRCLSTVSPTRILVNADADLNWDLCQFYNMGTITFGGTTGYCTNAKFQGCGQITPKGTDLSGGDVSGYEGTADTGAVNWDVATSTSGLLDDMSFTKGTAATHAMEFDATNSPTTINLVGHSYSGYGATGSTSATILIRRTSGTVTINVSGGNTPTYKSLGATVNVVSSTTVTLTGLVANTEVRVYDTSDDSVVDGVENSGTSFAFSYTAGENVYIRIFHIQYLPADITNFTIPGSATSLPIQQIYDRNYDNP
jgi:hypothetical protein